MREIDTRIASASLASHAPNVRITMQMNRVIDCGVELLIVRSKVRERMVASKHKSAIKMWCR